MSISRRFRAAWAAAWTCGSPARLLMVDAVLGCALGIVIGFGWAEWLDRGLHR